MSYNLRQIRTQFSGRNLIHNLKALEVENLANQRIKVKQRALSSHSLCGHAGQSCSFEAPANCQVHEQLDATSATAAKHDGILTYPNNRFNKQMYRTIRLVATLAKLPAPNSLVTASNRTFSTSSAFAMPIYRGGCYCGELKYTIDVSPDDARTSLCHCKNCKVRAHLHM